MRAPAITLIVQLHVLAAAWAGFITVCRKSVALRQQAPADLRYTSGEVLWVPVLCLVQHDAPLHGSAAAAKLHVWDIRHGSLTHHAAYVSHTSCFPFPGFVPGSAFFLQLATPLALRTAKQQQQQHAALPCLQQHLHQLTWQQQQQQQQAVMTVVV
jgi:hypothetical protein